MDSSAVPAALRERLGPDASGALLDLLEVARREWSENVIDVCTARFECRLVEETSKLRLEMTQLGASLRAEMAELGASLRGEMAGLGGSLRVEMAELGGSLREEMAGLGGSLRHEMSDGRFELLKWCFIFWVGQLVTVAGVVGLMLRVFRP